MIQSLPADTIKKLYRSGWSQPRIGKHFGVTATTVCRFMKQHGIKARPLTDVCPTLIKVSENLRGQAWALYKKGLNRDQVGEQLGITESAVRKALKNRFRTAAESVRLTTRKNTHKLNSHQLQCILGTLLGDGALIYRERGRAFYYTLQIVHSAKQRGYLEHIRRLVRAPKLLKVTKWDSYKPGSVQYKMSYQNKGALMKIASIVRIEKKKVNPKWVNMLTLEGIAYWFMDDGSSSWRVKGKSSFVRFSTQSYNRREVGLLLGKLRSYGLDARLQHSAYGKGFEISIPVRGSQRFLRLIRRYVWPIRCMRYKIKLAS